MATPQKIAVIGIGDDGIDALAPTMRDRILNADVIVGPERALQMVPPECAAKRQPMDSDLEELARQISTAQDKKIVILVFGDPMFYGLARYVSDRVGRDRFEVMPHVSSMQLAFARVMESWDEAYLTNLASHPLDAVVEKIRTAQRVGLFTTDTCGPWKSPERYWISTSTTSRLMSARTSALATKPSCAARWQTLHAKVSVH